MRIFLVVLVICTLGSGLGHIEAQNAPSAYFGLIGAAEVAALDQLGAGWVQIPFEWHAFQPESPDDWREDVIDLDYLAAVAQSGRTVVGVISGTPAWASASGVPSAVPDGLALPITDPGNGWAAFVERLTRTYRLHGVHHWVIYDAPNVQLGEGAVSFAGDEADYARLLGVAYRAARAGDRSAVIHLAALNWWVDAAAGREPYLARLLRALAADPLAADNDHFFDVATVRVTDNTAMVGTTLDETRAILDQAEIGFRPIWLETGVSDRASIFALTPEQAADFVVQAAALGMAHGAARIGLMGLVVSGGVEWLPARLRAPVTPTPAFEMTQRVIDQFAASSAARSYRYYATELIVLTQDAQDVYVFWSYDDEPVYAEITSAVEGETGQIYTRAGEQSVQSRLIDWPAVFVVEAPGAQPDANGFLTVAGSPVWLAVERDEAFVRVVYALVAGEWARLK